MKMAGPTILSITLVISTNSEKLYSEPTNDRLNNEIQEMVHGDLNFIIMKNIEENENK